MSNNSRKDYLKKNCIIYVSYDLSILFYIKKLHYLWMLSPLFYGFPFAKKKETSPPPSFDIFTPNLPWWIIILCWLNRFAHTHTHTHSHPPKHPHSHPTHTQPITQINKKIHLLPNTKKLKHTKRHKYSNNKKSKILSYENIIWKENEYISDFNDFPTLKISGLNSCGLIQILRLQLSLA